jgi:phosphoadenosine phosphosulfate reductase
LKIMGLHAEQRADQTAHRSTLGVFGRQWGREKVLPILAWSTRDVDTCLAVHDLPRHPLELDGYATIGDWHTSRPLEDADVLARDSRFLGLKQECGLHRA